MKNLIIVESPTKARTLSRFLGKDYLVEATMGHIKDLPKSKLSIDVEKNFKPDYQPVEGKNEYVKKVLKSAKSADKIFIATDPDREGEAIAKHVDEVLKSNDKIKILGDQLKRIVFHEITQDAVEDAINHPRSIDENLVEAQIARRVLDRLVGYKLSPLLWKKVRRGLSAGRVQSVAVRLIVEREEEIKAFKPEEYWEIYCELKKLVAKKDQINEFIVKLAKSAGKKIEIKSEKTAKSVVSDLKSSHYKVSDVKKREIAKSPYPPFTTSTMTQSAARLFGWSAKRTMSIAQRLYEDGLITYHRTDSTNISKQALSSVRSYIKKEFGDSYLPQKPRFYKTKSKSAQEAHEAIRPTKVSVRDESVTKRGKYAQKLYSLIWKRFVACQMTNSVYDETVIEVLANEEKSGNSYLLRASGQVQKFDGWRKVIPKKKTNGNDKQSLPEVEENEKLDLIKVDPQQKFTQPPPRFNEASLIKTLEKLGIGRPSTYAPIISTIQVRNYVEKEESRFYPTKVGEAVNSFLTKNFPKVFDYDFTAGMENELDNVASGETKWTKMMKDFYAPFEKKLENVEEKAERVKIETEKLGRKCPTCKKEGRTGNKRGELVIRVGRFGKFISCSNFPDCKHTEKYLEKFGMKCPECGKGDVIIKKTKKRRKFYGCSRYPKCRWASWRKPSIGNTDSKKTT